MITPVIEIASNAPAFYRGYINRVPDTDLIPFLRAQQDEATEFFWDIPSEHLDFRYAPGKWSIREVFGHIIDVERIMAYRMLRFARADKTALPGFDENDYVDAASFASWSDEMLMTDFTAVRTATLSMMTTFSPGEWSQKGIANGQEIGVEALGCIIGGHLAHHLEVVRERYFQ